MQKREKLAENPFSQQFFGLLIVDTSLSLWILWFVKVKACI